MPTRAQVETFLTNRYDYWEIDAAPHAQGPSKFTSPDVGYYYARGVKFGNDGRTASVDTFRLIRVNEEWRAMGSVDSAGVVTGSPLG